jgi:hypothetical protein
MGQFSVEKPVLTGSFSVEINSLPRKCAGEAAQGASAVHRNPRRKG